MLIIVGRCFKYEIRILIRVASTVSTLQSRFYSLDLYFHKTSISNLKRIIMLIHCLFYQSKPTRWFLFSQYYENLLGIEV